MPTRKKSQVEATSEVQVPEVAPKKRSSRKKSNVSVVDVTEIIKDALPEVSVNLDTNQLLSDNSETQTDTSIEVNPIDNKSLDIPTEVAISENTSSTVVPALIPEINQVFVTVKLDLLSGKVTSDNSGIHINNDTANIMNAYVKGNTGKASYKLTVDGLSVGNIIDQSTEKYAIYKAPLQYWETMIELHEILERVNYQLRFISGRKITWMSAKKSVHIARKIKQEVAQNV